MPQLTCPHCDSRIAAKEKHLGKQIVCPRCRETFIAPSAPAAAEIDETPQQATHLTSAAIACPVCEQNIVVNPKSFNRQLQCGRCQNLYRVTQRSGENESDVEVIAIPPKAFDAETLGGLFVLFIGGILVALTDFQRIGGIALAAGTLTFSLSLVCRRLLRIEFFIRCSTVNRD